MGSSIFRTSVPTPDEIRQISAFQIEHNAKDRIRQHKEMRSIFYDRMRSQASEMTPCANIGLHQIFPALYSTLIDELSTRGFEAQIHRENQYGYIKVCLKSRASDDPTNMPLLTNDITAVQRDFRSLITSEQTTTQKNSELGKDRQGIKQSPTRGSD